MKRTTNRDIEPPVCARSAKTKSIQYHAAEIVLTGIKLGGIAGIAILARESRSISLKNHPCAPEQTFAAIGRSSIVGSYVRIVYPSGWRIEQRLAANVTPPTAAMLMASAAVLRLGYPRVRSRALRSPNNQAGGDHASFWT